MPNHSALNSPADPDQPLIRSQTAISNAELESMRRQSIRVLGSVAATLEAAEYQKQTLLAEVLAAQQTLQALANERESVEASLAVSRSQLDLAATQLERAEVGRVGILREVDELLSASVQSRAALAAEIVALERQRDELTRVAWGSPFRDEGPAPVHPQIARLARLDAPPNGNAGVDVPPDMHAAARTRIAATDALTAATPNSLSVLLPPTWLVVMRSARATFEHFALMHPIHPGFGNVATALFIALLLAMALLLSPLAQVFGGLQLLVVTSGSMAPAIPTGGMVGVRPVPASDLRIGDVITFANPDAPDVLVTHRIVSVDVRNGQTMLTTKGDANDAVDALSAPASRAVGRVEFALPWLGDAMLWLGSPTAKIVSVGLATLALALSVASVRRSTRHSFLAH